MKTRLTLKDHFRESRLVNDRLIFSAILAGILFAIILVRLATLQIIEYKHFNDLSHNNRVSTQPLVPQRGLIYDRNGVVLAENIPTFSLELTPENVHSVDNTLTTLTKLFSLSSDNVAEIKKTIKEQRGFRQVVIRKSLTEKEVALFSVNQHKLTGVDVVARLIRHYPHGALFAHTVGYVGRLNERDQKNVDRNEYKGTLQIGKTGVEKEYEKLLHGKVGFRHIETNVQGRTVRELHREPSHSGQELFLHLDINLQKVASEVLADYNGAIVALEVKTGGVLAMVSKPDFNPNSFVSGISSKEYDLLRDSADRPLFNRSIRGHYPPASTLKPFVALAGLERGVIKSNSKTLCPGWYKLPGHDHRYRCWKTHGHGIVGLKESLAQSCDVYFYDLANSMGIDQLHGFLDLFGFGHLTGIDVPSESAGLSPSKEWKVKAKNQVWYPGETLISGIGQGFNQTTPVQLAQATAMLAMRGVHVKPKVARAIRDYNTNELTLLSSETAESLPVINKKNWESVIDSMVEVTTGARGTARLLGKTLPFNVAGKTGTAQVFGIKQNQKYDAETLEKKLQDHALFVGFAPAENPEFVVVVVAENGGSGSKVAAPMAKRMIEEYFGLVAND